MNRELTCEEIADYVGGLLIGQCMQKISGVSSLKEAMATDVSFLRDSEKYRRQVLVSKAGVVLVPMDFNEPAPKDRAWIKCVDPSRSIDVIANIVMPPKTYAPGIAKSARIAASAKIANNVHIGENVVIGENVKIGGNTAILPGVVLCDDVCIGENCILYPNVVIRERCLIGNRVILQPGVVVGGDGFGYNKESEGYTKEPQVGIVQIDDDVEIGANSTIDRARLARTWIQHGTKIDNLVQIGHNVIIGPYCFIVAQTGIAGSTSLGKCVTTYGQAGIAGHLVIGESSTIGGQAGIRKDVPPNSQFFGTPAKPYREYAKEQLNIKKIEELMEKVEGLTKKVEELEKRF